MAHGILRGDRHGDVHGLKHGSLLFSSGITGVTRDATSGIYCPASAAEWTLLLAAAGLATGNPTSAYLCQEASGNLADSVGANTLTQSGAGHLYQQPVSGWARFAIKNVDGTASQKWFNTTTSPNPNTNSTLVLAYISVPAGSPAAARDVMGTAALDDCRFNTTGKLRAGFGAAADLVNDNRGTTIPLVMKVDNTATVSAMYTSVEKFIGTYSIPASANLFFLGGQTATAWGGAFLYVAEFASTAAQLTDAQVKTLLQTLGWTIPWT